VARFQIVTEGVGMAVLDAATAREALSEWLGSRSTLSPLRAAPHRIESLEGDRAQTGVNGRLWEARRAAPEVAVPTAVAGLEQRSIGP
jgi:hypothetical protein